MRSHPRKTIFVGLTVCPLLPQPQRRNRMSAFEVTAAVLFVLFLIGYAGSRRKS
jgi:hypothetical protein